MQHTATRARLSRLTLAWLMGCGVCGQVGIVGVAAAEPVWRCSSADGSLTYQSTACQDAGQALPADKHPTPEDREASARVAEREAKLARTMGRQRVQREKDQPVSAHTSLSGPVRQVSVGQREEDRLKARRKRGTNRVEDPNSRRARQHRQDVFRAEAPGRSRKQSGQAQADAGSASPR